MNEANVAAMRISQISVIKPAPSERIKLKNKLLKYACSTFFCLPKLCKK